MTVGVPVHLARRVSRHAAARHDRHHLPVCVPSGRQTDQDLPHGVEERVQGGWVSRQADPRHATSAVRTSERVGVPRSVAMSIVGHKTESIHRRYAIVDEAMQHEAAMRLDSWTHASFQHSNEINATPVFSAPVERLPRSNAREAAPDYCSHSARAHRMIDWRTRAEACGRRTMETHDRPIFTVFYSWQSDLEGRANRNLIENALEKAAKTLRADDSLQVVPVMDRDTAGKSGAPDIAATIFGKIDVADAFVADISFVTPPTPEAPELKRCPNPNVLLELGYALHRHGWERVLLVFNEHYGSLSDLPFDLRARRVITYTSAPEDGDRATPRKLLHDRFVADLRVMAQEGLPTPRTSIRDAVEAIEHERRNRLALLRIATSDINGRLHAAAPDLAKESLDSATFIAGLDAATSAIVDYLELARAVAAMDDRQAAVDLTLALEDVAIGYNTLPGFSGTFWYHQFEYWMQVGYELLLGLIGLLLRERRFEALGEVLRTRLHIPNAPRGGSDQVLIRYLSPRGGSQQAAWGQAQLNDSSRRYISPIGQLLLTRYESPPLANIISWREMQAADLFLALWAIGHSDTDDYWEQWIPHAAVLMREPPRFLTDAIRVGPAREIAAALGLSGPEALRDLYVDRFRHQIRKYFSHMLGSLPEMNFPNAHKIGSEP
jgi:hypothetical protein